jgi:hypothetical protein
VKFVFLFILTNLKDMTSENYKILYMSKLFKHDCSFKGESPFFLFNDMTFNAIKTAVNVSVEKLEGLNFNDNGFIEKLDFLKSNAIFNGLILTYGFQKKELDFFKKENINYINFWMHPFKLMEDLLVSMETNNQNIYSCLKKHQIREEKFKIYAHYWKTKIKLSTRFTSISKLIEGNSLLFIGQKELSLSLERDGHIYSLCDFQSKVDEYKKIYTKLYFSPHASFYDENGNELWSEFSNLKIFLNNNPEIEVIREPIYNLLSINKIKKIVAISSPRLFEAQFFDKEIEYLFKPLFQFDNNDNSCGISIDNHQLFNPKFWADILESVCDVNKNAPEIKFDNPQNKIRSLDIEEGSLYCDYKYLDMEKGNVDNIFFMEKTLLKLKDLLLDS